jgi:site-specific recombinase XerD
MLQAERRHTKKCNERQEKRAAKNPEEPPKLPPKELKKCNCPLWVIGVDIRGHFHRESLDTRDLTTAAIRIQKLELGEPLSKPMPDAEIETAWKDYTDILQSQRDVKDSSITGSYRPVKNALLRFAEHKGIRMMNQISETFCDGLVGQWKDLGAATRHHYIQIIQDFFGVGFSRGWIAQDPSTKLVRPKRPVQKCTLPFDLEDEDPRIVAAIPHWNDAIQRPNHNGISVWAKHPKTAAALMYVLRFTGVRISDGYLFEPRCLKKRVVNGKDAYCYFLPRQQKTQEPVFIVIRPDVGEFIVKAPRLTDKYAFYDPEGTDPEAKTTEEKRKSNEHKHQWGTRFRQDALHYLEKVSGVAHIHPHRFRDTFAVDFLSNDGDIRALSRLLGHKDIATTLRYYEHYIPSDQKKAIEAMMKTWEDEEPINVIPFRAKKKASGGQ